MCEISRKQVNTLKQVKFAPYSDVYRDGTLAVLKRNFPWMSRQSDEKLYHWLAPLIAYKWLGDTDPGDIPYRNGLVILDGDNVVGYCGATYSYQNIDGKKRLYVCFSTFAVDEDYRFYIFPAVKELCTTADVITDFTPRESMRRLFVERFHFQYLNDKRIFMLPVPSLSNRVKLRFIDKAEDISDPQQRKVFLDHNGYNVKFCTFERDGEKGGMFYCAKWYMKWKKRIPCGRRIDVLKVYNSALLSRNLREIAWKLQMHEGVITFFVCDAAFLGENFSHPMKISRPVSRLVLSREDISQQYDLMYSELSTLLA